MKPFITTLFLVFFHWHVVAQELKFDKAAAPDSAALTLSMQNLAKEYLLQSKSKNFKISTNDRFKIEILASDYQTSVQTIQSLRKTSKLNFGHPHYIPYELFAKAKIEQLKTGLTFNNAYQTVFKTYIANCNDQMAYSANIVFTTYDAVAQFTYRFRMNYENISTSTISYSQALTLLKTYFLYYLFATTEPIAINELNLDKNKRYKTEEELIISPRDGAEISVITVRKRNAKPMSAVMVFTIYADATNADIATLAASKGYVGVVATSRGKRLSNDSIEPYKHEYKDVYATIDWVSKQEWNNGKVGMYGGSYNAFSQWASMKEKVHPALKTIVSSASAAPGIDVPMENNIFYNFPYKWIPYVTNNKFLDHATNSDRNRWENLENTWFASGKAYHKMDSLDGTPNPIFQEWISHPAYDKFWQNMIPYKGEFSHIDIPILTTTGYYDDGQRGAIYYHTEHTKYNPKAEHYLLIGPYDHWGAQTRFKANLRGYQIDKVAHINIREELVFDWFNYILKNKKKPSILKDKVNFQVMGNNKWISKPSLTEMHNDSLVYYLRNDNQESTHKLVTEKNKEENAFKLSIDFADRSQKVNSAYYPWPIVKDSINLKDGFVFMSKPFERETIMNGSFSGRLRVSSNKNDFDFSVTLYEFTPEGKYFQLSYYIGRASYAATREKRVLPNRNQLFTISFTNTRIVSKKFSEGSKLVVVLNGNKNAYGQINYGTGQDVSYESIDHAILPLKLNFYSNSSITIPIWEDK